MEGVPNVCVRGVSSQQTYHLLLPDPRKVTVLDGGQVSPDYSFRKPICPLRSVSVLFGGRSKPDSDGSAEDRLDDGGGEGDQQLLWQIELPELMWEVQPLLGRVPDSLCGRSTSTY